MTIGHTSSVQQQKHLSRGSTFTNPLCTVPIYATAKTMTDVLLDADAPEHIDLLSLDVGGAELHVLQGIDFSQFSFSYMLIECWEFEPIQEYLAQYGYSPVSRYSQRDWLFKKTSDSV